MLQALNKEQPCWGFRRVLGYSILGGLAAASLQGLGWLTVHSAALRPVWSLFHVAALALGLVLAWQARQPVWLEDAARVVWVRARSFAGGWGGGAPLILGAFWALLPCGLLYSALLVAAMAGSVLGGAVVMALFALGTAVAMTVGPWAWLRLRGSRGIVSNRTGSGRWGVRLAGLALAASSIWALWMAFAQDAAPWCITT